MLKRVAFILFPNQWPRKENALKVSSYPEKHSRTRNRELLKSFTTHIAVW